jgi:hypothetical protein
LRYVYWVNVTIRLLLLPILLLSVPGFAQHAPVHKHTAHSKVVPVLSVKVIPAERGTWGYDIFSDNRLYIHQPSVPGLPGNKGFATKAKAQKAADIVCQKIRKGIMPPTVSIEELRKANLIPTSS